MATNIPISTSAPAEKVYDVFISGAGPVGLFLAYQLERMGHSVYCCDTKSGPTDQSRSSTLSARTLEVLALNGLGAPFCKASVAMKGYRNVYQGRTIGTFNVVGGESTVFPNQSAISQSKVEEILIGVTQGLVHWQTKLVDYNYHQDAATYEDGRKGEEDIVVCTVQALDDASLSPSPPTRKIKAKYLVGADGTHSFVRKHYRDHHNEKWNFDGYSIGSRFVLCDAKVGGKDVDKAFNATDTVYSHRNGFVAITPLGSGDSKDYVRVIMNQEYYYRTADRTKTHGLAPEKPPSIEEVNIEMLKRLAPLDIFITEARWRTIYRINQRKANGFRRGRIFLVGDSSHCFSPIYGLGLNSGFQDAHNLAWKLSVVLKGYAPNPEVLLNSFSVEREEIVKSTMDVVGSITEVGMGKQNFLTAALARFWMSIFTNTGWINRTFMQWVMQTAVKITNSSTLVVKTTSRSKLIASGKFMPDTAVLRRRVIADQIERKTFHEILAQGAPTSKYVALWVSTRPSSHDPFPWTHMFWTAVAPWRHAVRPLVVESTWHVYNFDERPHYALECTKDSGLDGNDNDVNNAFWIEDSLVYPDALTQRIGLGHYINEKVPPAAIVVIRPDNYIAYSVLVRSPKDIDNAFAELGTFLE